MAAHYDITIEQGATFVLDIQVNDIDLTGFVARMQGRANHSATSVVFEWTTANGALAISHQGNHSHILITVSATATALLSAPQFGVYDMEYEYGGVVTRIIEGSFQVTPEVTR